MCVTISRSSIFLSYTLTSIHSTLTLVLSQTCPTAPSPSASSHNLPPAPPHILPRSTSHVPQALPHTLPPASPHIFPLPHHTFLRSYLIPSFPLYLISFLLLDFTDPLFVHSHILTFSLV